MIAIIRIHGMIKVRFNIDETLNRLRLRRKYCCVVVNDSPEAKGMITKVRDFVAYGNITEETLAKLIKERAEKIGDKKAKIENPEKIAKELIAGKSFEELKIKPFFRLHPPRGGINSKKHYPKGVLGDNKEGINKLIERML